MVFRIRKESVKHNQRGDTLVEVLLATVVVSIVMAGAYTLSNKASSINLQSSERSKAAGVAQAQAELLRSARDSYDPQGPANQTWNRVTNAAQSPNAVQPLGTDCDAISNIASNRGTSNVFHINSSGNFQSGSVLVQDTLYHTWVESEIAADGGYWDFHVFVCWEGAGLSEVQKMKVILRLEENNE